VAPGDGKERFATRGQLEGLGVARDETAVPAAFRAVVSYEWPPGLVAVFLVEKGGRFELRRRPMRGQENSTEPLFFALPPEEEPDAAKLAGGWICEATRGAETAKESLGWDLAIDGDQIAGRFGPETQYRFAYLTGGTFRAPRIELQAEYTGAVYDLTGTLQAARLRGTWRRADTEEQGTWEAWQEPVALAPPAGAVALFEWRAADGSPDRRYALEGKDSGLGWVRARRPLCRVWRP
jgi:hypothetical protein